VLDARRRRRQWNPNRAACEEQHDGREAARRRPGGWLGGERRRDGRREDGERGRRTDNDADKGTQRPRKDDDDRIRGKGRKKPGNPTISQHNDTWRIHGGVGEVEETRKIQREKGRCDGRGRIFDRAIVLGWLRRAS